MRLTKPHIFAVGYMTALALCAFAGYYTYADYKLQTLLKKQNSINFQSDVTYIDLPRITVNLSPQENGASGTVRMDITLEVENRFAERVSGVQPRISDRIVNYTRTLKYDDLATPHSTEWLKPDILTEINKASAPLPVKDILFKKFMVM